VQTRPDQLAGRLVQTLIFVRPDYEASRVCPPENEQKRCVGDGHQGPLSRGLVTVGPQRLDAPNVLARCLQMKRSSCERHSSLHNAATAVATTLLQSEATSLPCWDDPLRVVPDGSRASNARLSSIRVNRSGVFAPSYCSAFVLTLPWQLASPAIAIQYQEEFGLQPTRQNPPSDVQPRM